MSWAPLGSPVVPEVYRITATDFVVTSMFDTTSSPLPPRAELMSRSHGMEFGAGAVSASRRLVIIGSGSPRMNCFALGIASIMFTDTMVSNGVVRRSFSKVEAALSQTMATRAAWSLKGDSSSWAVYSGLCSTTIAPSFRTAKYAATCCGQLGRTMATRSPARTPRARRPAAADRTCLSSSL